MTTQSIYKELYAGVTLKEVRIFIIESVESIIRQA